MASIVKCRGAAGNVYDFHLHPIGTPFVSLPGVYFACKRTGGTSWDVLYVGETESFYDRLTARLSEHEGLGRSRAMGATHLGLMHVPGALDRLAIETELRGVLQPPCNRQPVPNALAGLMGGL